MSGFTTDRWQGAATVVPGNGIRKFVPADRNENGYVKDLYFYDSANGRHSLVQTTGLVPATLAATTTLTLAQSSGTYLLTAGSAEAITLPTPSASTTNGKVITFISTTNQAHTITAGANTMATSAGVRTTATAATAGAAPNNALDALISFVGAGAYWKVIYSYGWNFS